VLERASPNSVITNTGYLVEPMPHNSSPKNPMHWQAYAKVALAHGDIVMLDQEKNSRSATGRWNRRRERVGSRIPRTGTAAKAVEEPPLSRLFRFPSVVINGKSIELRVCRDIMALSQSLADVLVVPAMGLPDRKEEYNAAVTSLKKNGFAVINDTDQNGRFQLVRQSRLLKNVGGESQVSWLPQPKSRAPRKSGGNRPRK
jgi:hypothetical protein